MESHHAMKINIKERTVVIASQDGGVLFLEKEPFERKWSQIGNRILITCKKKIECWNLDGEDVRIRVKKLFQLGIRVESQGQIEHELRHDA